MTKETQELWLKTFELKSLDEDFIPQFSKEVQEALDSALKGKEIKINQKDLLKIAQKGREKYIKEILPTFQEPNAIFRDEKGDLIFARKIDNRLFFANITREYDKEFLNVSLSPKKDNALKSKLENAKEVYYQKSDSELRDSSAHKASTGFLSSTSKSDTAIIPQRTLKGGDILFKDDLGKAHRLTKETQELWLNTFNLKSLDEDFIPSLPQEISEKIGKTIRLNINDLKKLVANKRTKYLSDIKATFEKPQAVFIDEKGDLIFAKTLDDKLFFVNVSRDYGESFKGLSLSPKKQANLLNKLKNAKEVYYNQLASELRDSTAQQASTGFLSSTSKANTDIIPQKHQELEKLQKAHEKAQERIKDALKTSPNSENFFRYAYKPNELIALEKQYFNQEIPQEIGKILENYPRLSAQKTANFLRNKSEAETIRKFGEWIDELAQMQSTQAKKELESLVSNSLESDFKKQLGFENAKFFQKDQETNKALNKLLFKIKKGNAQELKDALGISQARRARREIEEAFDLHPSPEFGTNYAEFYHDGKGAINKLIAESKEFAKRKEAGDISASPQYDKTPQEFSGQVAGAFYRKDLEELSGNGEIDLVWGEITDKANHKGYGLAHILDKHPELDVHLIPEIVEKGKLVNQNGTRFRLEFENYVIGLSGEYKGEKRNFIITAFERKRI